MNKQTSLFKTTFLQAAALAAVSSLILCVNALEARRAYSYADMYSPQETEAEVVKPKKKIRKPKSKPISVRVQKPVDKETENAKPVTDLPDETKEVTKASKSILEPLKSRRAEPKEKLTNIIPEKKLPNADKAKSVTLEELLGADIIKGMSSR